MPSAVPLSNQPIETRVAGETAVQRHERQVGAMRQFCDIGVELAHSIEYMAKAPDAPERAAGIGSAFANVAKAARYAIMLENRLLEEFEARAAGIMTHVTARREQAYKSHRQRIAIRKDHLGEIVELALDGVPAERESRFDLNERLNDSLEQLDDWSAL